MNMSREQRIEGQRKGAEAKNQKRLELAQRRQVVDTVTDWSSREELPIAALSTVLALMRSISEDLEHLEPSTSALDLQRKAEAAKTVHSLMRLELGESTSNTLTATVDKDELAARLARLRGAESPEHGASST